jgi:hypothetical protein
MELLTDYINRIRAEYIDIDNKIKELQIKRRELSEEMRIILGNIDDKNDCSEIINFSYLNKEKYLS